MQQGFLLLVGYQLVSPVRGKKVSLNDFGSDVVLQAVVEFGPVQLIGMYGESRKVFGELL